MSKVLESFNFSNKGRLVLPRRPWDTWLNGQIHEISREEMGDVSTQVFKGNCFNAAKSKGLQIHTHANEDGSLVIQARKADEATLAKWKAAKAAKKTGANGKPAEEATPFDEEDMNDVVTEIQHVSSVEEPPQSEVVAEPELTSVPVPEETYGRKKRRNGKQ